MKVKNIISDTQTLYGLKENDRIKVTGQSWHGYPGAIGYEDIDPYYDDVEGWEIDEPESIIPL